MCKCSRFRVRDYELGLEVLRLWGRVWVWVWV